jgi:hypothetical protein
VRPIRVAAASITGVFVALIVGCVGDPARFRAIEKDRAAMVAAGKAAGVIDSGLPANCTRAIVDSNWGTIDEERRDRRCSRFARRGVLVFHRAGRRWQFVAAGRDFHAFGGCPIKGVPTGVARRLRLC